MAQVEAVALWVGLLSSVVSIVLSIVAIAFSLSVDKRSRDVTVQTISSLQKIESAVERLSSDTRELIKAGWDKMLGNVGNATAPVPSDPPTKEIASGIAAELRAEIGALAAGGSTALQPEVIKLELERVLKGFEAAIASQLRGQRLERPSDSLDRTVAVLNDMTTEARALVRELRGHHLTRKEYKNIMSGPLAEALSQVRQSGLLIPVSHRDPDGSAQPCYYFPASLANVIRAALPLVDQPTLEVRKRVREVLRAVGYPSGHPEHWNPPPEPGQGASAD